MHLGIIYAVLGYEMQLEKATICGNVKSNFLKSFE